MRYERGDPDPDNPGINSTGHPPVTIQPGGARKFLEGEDGEKGDADNGRDSSRKNRRQADRRNDQPRSVGAPDRAEIFPETEMDQCQHHSSPEEGDEDDPKVGEKNRIAQDAVRGHQWVAEFARNAAMIRFKRTAVVCMQPATKRMQVMPR